MRRFLPSIVTMILLTALAVGAFLTVGQTYTDGTAGRLLDAMQTSIQTLSIAVITGSATIIPLMLTVLGMAKQANIEYGCGFYQQVRWVTLMCAGTILLSTLLIMIMTVPMTETNEVYELYRPIYYTVVGTASLIVGLFSAMIVMLADAVTDVISGLSPADA